MKIEEKIRSVVVRCGGTGALLSFVSFAVAGVGCSSSGSSPPTLMGLTRGGSSGAFAAGGSSGAGSPGVGGSTAPFGGAPPGGGTANLPPPPGGGGRPVGGAANVGGLGNTGNVGGFGNAGGFGNTGGVLPGSGGVPNGGAGAVGGSGPAGGSAGAIVDPTKGCEGLSMPAVAGDYAANGPMPTMTVNNTGSDGNFTIVRPTTLGSNGFKHPIVTWGNGITTNPTLYPGLLGAIASHGFVVIASNSTSVTTAMMVDGLDWMIAQNGKAGDYQGKLNPTCLATVGYSLGGGGAVGAGAHANVVVTVSMHGVAGASNALHGPLLLLTAETDTVCVPAVMVTPTFNSSVVQTFMGTISMASDTGNQGHLIPVDGALALITPPALNMAERAAVIAWLRLWVYKDQGAKKYFYNDDAILAKAPWTMPQRKNWK